MLTAGKVTVGLHLPQFPEINEKSSLRPVPQLNLFAPEPKSGIVAEPEKVGWPLVEAVLRVVLFYSSF